MRKQLLVPFVFVTSTTALACSFQMKAGSGTQTPAQGTASGSTSAAPATTTPAPVPTPKPGNKPSIARLGKRPGTTPAGTGTGTAPAPTGAPTTAPTGAPTTAPTGALPPVMTGTNLFGTGTADLAGWKGTFFVIPAGATKLPDLGAAAPGGFLFAPELNVTAKPMTGGFPGIDANRNEDFAIRWEAPLVVDNEADYTFRIVSDDGAKVLIDGMAIVENDAANPAPTEKSGPVHLVKGTHQITVDYFQTKGGVALQLFCKTQGQNDKVCPLKL
jgi:PA14 domain